MSTCLVSRSSNPSLVHADSPMRSSRGRIMNESLVQFSMISTGSTTTTSQRQSEGWLRTPQPGPSSGMVSPCRKTRTPAPRGAGVTCTGGSLRSQYNDVDVVVAKRLVRCARDASRCRSCTPSRSTGRGQHAGWLRGRTVRGTLRGCPCPVATRWACTGWVDTSIG